MDNSKIAAGIFNKHAEAYQQRFMDVSLYHDTLDRFCSELNNPDAELLELACGPGNITQYILGKHPDYKILGADLAPKMTDLAKTNNPTANFIVMDCREIATIQKPFDGIICGFCLPYISKEETAQLISDSAQLLKPGGKLYISTMIETPTNKSGYRKGSQGDAIYMHYHQADYIESALTENNFKTIVSKHQEYPDNTGTTDLIIIAKLIS